METVVVAFEGEKNGRRLKELLESSGTAACLLCRSADQVKRLVRQQRLTAVVCGYKFPDGTAEELAGEHLHQVSAGPGQQCLLQSASGCRNKKNRE